MLQKPYISAFDQMIEQSELKFELIYRRVSRMWRNIAYLLCRRSQCPTHKKLIANKGCCVFLATKEKNCVACAYHQQKTLPFRHWALCFSGFLGRFSRETDSRIPRELGSLPGRDSGSLTCESAFCGKCWGHWGVKCFR